LLSFIIIVASFNMYLSLVQTELREAEWIALTMSLMSGSEPALHTGSTGCRSRGRYGGEVSGEE
jgi:hypothetical protein